MDWSDEQKLCFSDHYRHNIILWDTLYIVMCRGVHVMKMMGSGSDDWIC
jgi:hypothetical protein